MKDLTDMLSMIILIALIGMVFFPERTAEQVRGTIEALERGWNQAVESNR